MGEMTGLYEINYFAGLYNIAFRGVLCRTTGYFADFCLYETNFRGLLLVRGLYLISYEVRFADFFVHFKAIIVSIQC